MLGDVKDVPAGGIEECELVVPGLEADVCVLTFLIGLYVSTPLHFLPFELDCIACQWASILTCALAGHSAGLCKCGNREGKSRQENHHPGQSPRQ